MSGLRGTANWIVEFLRAVTFGLPLSGLDVVTNGVAEEVINGRDTECGVHTLSINVRGLRNSISLIGVLDLRHLHTLQLHQGFWHGDLQFSQRLQTSNMRRLGVTLWEYEALTDDKDDPSHPWGFDPLLTIAKHLDLSALTHLELLCFPIISPQAYLDPQIIQLFQQVETLSIDIRTLDNWNFVKQFVALRSLTLRGSLGGDD